MILRGRLLADAHAPPVAGWLRVTGDRISEVGRGEPPQPPDAGSAGALICPGFADAHVHLPQMDVVGCDGLELLQWLESVIFPAEARWGDAGTADAQAAAAYRRMLRCGTLGYAGFLTSHLHSLVAALRAGHALPLRGLAGQVLMDRNAPGELLCADRGAVARLARSERGRLEATVNPRFAPACSERMLALAGRRARRGAAVQTHLAESPAECDLVRRLFPDDPHYTAVYDRHGLLTGRTLLAHCVHLRDDEWRLIAGRGSVVVHCPGANTFLRSGLFDLDAARRHGVRLALGSDVAAGPDLAMPRVARAMIETAKVRAMAGAGNAVPTPAEAWRLITRGNAEALGFHDAGKIEPGAAADLLILDAPPPDDPHVVSRLIYTWDDACIDRVVLNGRLLDPKAV